MAQPLVSIHAIIYNMAEFIHETLTSALEQDYDNLEVIAADDGSTDGTTEIIRDYVRKYPGRLVHVHGPNLGIGGNCNRALKASRGKYVAYQGGDDVLLPGKIKRQVEWLEADERRVLCGHDVEAFDHDTGKKMYLYSETNPLRKGRGAYSVVREGVLYAGPAPMFRASAMPAHGVDSRVRIVVDWILSIEALAAGGEYGYIDGVYARYRRHGGNVTLAPYAPRQDEMFVTLGLVESRYPHLVRSCRYARARLYRTAGMQAFRAGEIEDARRYWAASIREWPDWKSASPWLLTFFPDKISKFIVDAVKPPFRG